MIRGKEWWTEIARSKRIANLYVGGSSVFPTGGNDVHADNRSAGTTSRRPYQRHLGECWGCFRQSGRHQAQLAIARLMKILIVHNYYQRPGGEDDVVANEKAMLTEHGHEVRLVTYRNDDIVGLRSRFCMAWNTTYSREGRERVAAAIRELSRRSYTFTIFFRCSVRRFTTPAWPPVCRRADASQLSSAMRDRAAHAQRGAMREMHSRRARHWGVVHRCLSEFPAGRACRRAHVADHSAAIPGARTRLLCSPSHFMKSKFVEAGLLDEEIHVKPISFPSPRICRPSI